MEPGRTMQGTVRGFDPMTGAGTVFLDDGTVLEFSPAAFHRSGLRLLRPGQRVSLRVSPHGRVEALTVSTLATPDA